MKKHKLSHADEVKGGKDSHKHEHHMKMHEHHKEKAKHHKEMAKKHKHKGE
jgi:hypothetical protein